MPSLNGIGRVRRGLPIFDSYEEENSQNVTCSAADSRAKISALLAKVRVSLASALACGESGPGCLAKCQPPPRYIVIENVSALRARGLGEVVLDLASLGYVSWWDCIPAAAVGAPHRRDRLFLLAYRDRERRREEKSLQAGRNFSSSSAHMAYPDVQRGDWRGTSSAGRQELAHGSVGRVCATRTIEPSVGRAVDGLPGRLDRWPARPGEPQYEWEFSRCTARGETKGRTKRLKALGNAVVPQVGYVVGRALLMLDDMLKNI